jgi:hypothetical protein
VPTHLRPKVDRVEADLRDVMARLGTPRLRRWLMWIGVTFCGCSSGSRVQSLVSRWRSCFMWLPA